MLTPHDALYRTVCDFPDDDTPRLAFADYVEECGDPLRAAFIRTQVELARVPEYDPLWVKCRQFDPNALDATAMAHTLPKLPPGFGWRSFRFRRGFPWLAVAFGTDGFASRGGDLFAAAPVQALTFSDEPRKRTDVEALADSPHLARLRRLEFSVTRVWPESVGRLGHSPHAGRLTELAFEYNAIDADGLRVLVGSPLFSRLDTLELKRNVIPPALLTDALTVAGDDGNLRRLAIPYSHVTEHDTDNLCHLPVVRGVEELDLSDNPQMGVRGVEHLAESGAVRGLRVLNLANTFKGPAGLRALLGAGGLSGVRTLDLSANRLGPVAAKLLAESSGVRGLRVLRLGNNPVGDTGAIALAESRHLAGLLELDLADADIGDAGAAALASSPYLDNLLRLNLHRTLGRPFADGPRRALRDRFGGRVSL
jgi:uncharacterized protein (TIGR02996 family)